MSTFAETIYRQKYSLDGRETWPETARRVATHVLGALGYGPSSDEVRSTEQLILERKFLPGGRYLYASGRPLHQVQNCFLYRAEDTREGWGDLWRKVGMALMTGGGVGVDYSDVRERDAPVRRTGGLASGPISLMYSNNEIGRQVMQGGSRRSAIWAGLRWSHPDILEFIRIKDWSEAARAVRARDINWPMPMELTNVSVILDDAFFEALVDARSQRHALARHVYQKTVEKMLTTGEPGFSVDVGSNAGESLRNACTEVTSADDSDVCNLGSINLARIDSATEMAEAVELGTLFLLAGTVYSDVPDPKVAETRERNRRLGLGIMGLHEWLITRGRPYGPDPELGAVLDIYASSTTVARRHAGCHNLSAPVKTRAVAPTGTIGIIGETTTGMEPVFCRAFKRRYLNGGRWLHQYVIDPTAQRAVEAGVDPDSIEDAYSLAHDVRRRVEMQAWVQRYVDHGISSTINLPAPITEPDAVTAFGDMLLEHLPSLRGVTVYPNGARGGQPLKAVSYAYAASRKGTVFEEPEERCLAGACGI